MISKLQNSNAKFKFVNLTQQLGADKQSRAKRVIILFYLGNSVLALNDRQDTLRLDRGRLLKAVGVDSSQDLLFESHVVKFVNFHIPVRFEKFFSFFST